MGLATSQRQPATRGIALSVLWRGAARTWRVGPAGTLAIGTLGALLCAWLVGASAYLVFHDQLLASLMSREADIQYAYEDRIALLNTQLDRQTSRAMLDGQTLSTTMRDLAERSRVLEERAARIDALVRSLDTRAAAVDGRRSSASLLVPDVPLTGPLTGAGLRLDPQPSSRPAGEAETAEKRADLADPSRAPLVSAFDAIETRQAQQIEALRRPTQRAVDRLESALADAGVPARLWQVSTPARDVGGPFEPLPPAARGQAFDIEIAALRDTVARRERLVAVAGSVPLRRPLEGPLEVTSPFGPRLDPFYGRAAMHTGVDLMEAYGGPVRATARGIVTVAGSEGGYGNMVEIDHGNGLTTRYAHLSSVTVAMHERVEAGDVVGLVGATGRATGPHLHYETRVNGEPVDPTRFIRAGGALFPG